MYQHKYTRKNYTLTIEFLNGYLASVAKLKDALNRYLSHSYYFIEIPKQHRTLKEVVIGEIKNTVETFYEQNPTWTFDKELYARHFTNGMELQAQRKWKKCIRSNSETWLDLFSHDVKIEFPDKNCFVENFIEILKDFFGDDTFKMYLITGDILNDLTHHWGGIGFQDFIFETDQYVYLLHFDHTD